MSAARKNLEQGCEAYEKGNFAAAVQYFRSAARLGNPEAQVNLGNMYDAGEGVEADFKRAAHYYKLAASKGVPEAAYNLAVAYKQRGMPFWGAFWLRRAGELGDEDATAELNGGQR